MILFSCLLGPLRNDYNKQNVFVQEQRSMKQAEIIYLQMYLENARGDRYDEQQVVSRPRRMANRDFSEEGCSR